jgi:hypothetical protein
LTAALRAELGEVRALAASTATTATAAAAATAASSGTPQEVETRAATLASALESERAAHAMTSAALENEKAGRIRDAAKWAEAKALLKSVVDVLRGETDTLAAALAEAEAARDAARELSAAEALRADNAERALASNAARGVSMGAAPAGAPVASAANAEAAAGGADEKVPVRARPAPTPSDSTQTAQPVQPSALARLLLARAATQTAEDAKGMDGAAQEPIEDIARRKAAELRARAALFGGSAANAARPRTESTGGGDAATGVPRRAPPPAPVAPA